MLEFANTWMPFIYLYGVGGVAFVIGIYLIIKSKSLNIDNIDHKRWLYVLIFGFLYYAGIHTCLILLALDVNIMWLGPVLVILGVFIYFNWYVENRITVLEQGLAEVNDQLSKLVSKNTIED